MNTFSKIKLQAVREDTFEYNEQITNSVKALKVINSIEELDKAIEENLLVLCLDTKCNLISYSQLAKGGTNFCNFDMKALFKVLYLCNANKFILIHNHPSGISTPSEQDYKMTKQIEQASKLLGFDFCDHLVIGEKTYSSCINDYVKEIPLKNE